MLLDWAMTAYVHDYPQTTQSELHICVSVYFDLLPLLYDALATLLIFVCLMLKGYSAGALYASTTRVRPVLYLLKHWANGGRPHYVLISYPVDMVWALSMFRTSFFQTALEGLLRARKNAANSHVAAGQLPEARSLVGGQAAGKDSEGNQDVAADVLVIFGLQDQFTKEASYERWVSRLLELAPTPDSNSAALPSGAYTSAQAHDAEQSTVEECRVDGADHFWNRGSALDRLISAVESWNGKLARGIA